jgi:hypothetical protein
MVTRLQLHPNDEGPNLENLKHSSFLPEAFHSMHIASAFHCLCLTSLSREIHLYRLNGKNGHNHIFSVGMFFRRETLVGVDSDLFITTDSWDALAGL